MKQISLEQQENISNIDNFINLSMNVILMTYEE